MFSFNASHQTEEQNAYAARLYARLSEAVILKRVEISIGNWRPIENECHANASQIHLYDPSYAPVRGWLFFDFGNLLDRVQFLAHSAVRAPEGELWDITPSRASQDYPFLVAEESEEEFAAMVGGGIIKLWHVK